MIAVIGIGSPFGADQLGWRVVDRLQQAKLPKPESGQVIEIKKLDRPGSGVIEQLQNASAAIVIDALNSNHYAENEVVTVKAKELLEAGEDITKSLKRVSSHDFGLLEAIQLANSLNVLPENTTLVGLNLTTLNNIENSDDWFNVSQEHVQRVTDRVCQLLHTV